MKAAETRPRLYKHHRPPRCKSRHTPSTSAQQPRRCRPRGPKPSIQEASGVRGAVHTRQGRTGSHEKSQPRCQERGERRPEGNQVMQEGATTEGAEEQQSRRSRNCNHQGQGSPSTTQGQVVRGLTPGQRPQRIPTVGIIQSTSSAGLTNQLLTHRNRQEQQLSPLTDHHKPTRAHGYHATISTMGTPRWANVDAGVKWGVVPPVSAVL